MTEGALRHYIRDMISRLQGGGSQQCFEIIHYHAFISTQLNNYGIDLKSKTEHLPPKKRDDIDYVYGLQDLFSGVETEKYKTIFIDEVQDYHPEWIKLVRDYFLADGGEMLLFGDQSQNIYDRPIEGRKSPIVLGFGGWIRLTKSYRIDGSSPLINLFRNFHLQFLIRKYGESDVFPAIEAAASQGNLQLDLLNCEVYDDYDIDFELIFERISYYIRARELHPNDIVVIGSMVDLLIPINEMFKKSEKTQIMFEEQAEIDVLPRNVRENQLLLQMEKEKIRRRKKSFFMQNSGLIKLSTIHSFKGLEAETVFCILTPAPRRFVWKKPRQSPFAQPSVDQKKDANWHDSRNGDRGIVHHGTGPAAAVGSGAGAA